MMDGSNFKSNEMPTPTVTQINCKDIGKKIRTILNSESNNLLKNRESTVWRKNQLFLLLYVGLQCYDKIKTLAT